MDSSGSCNDCSDWGIFSRRQSLVAGHGLAGANLVTLRDWAFGICFPAIRNSRHAGLRNAGLSSFVDDSHRKKN